MPNTQILLLGNRFYQTLVGVTTKGLAALAHYCVHLSELRIHFQIASLDPPEIPNFAPFDGRSFPLGDCALTDLDVGDSNIPEASVLMVALILLRIFPRLNCIEHEGEGWEKVARAIGRLVDSLITQVRNPHLLHLDVPLMTLHQGRALDVGVSANHEICKKWPSFSTSPTNRLLLWCLSFPACSTCTPHSFT